MVNHGEKQIPWYTDDLVKILIVDNGSNYLERLQNLLSRYQIVTTTHDSLNNIEKDIELIILSGGSGYPVFYYPDHYQAEIDLIKTSHVPLIGICLGAQLLAYTYGCVLSQLQNRVKGETMLHILVNNNFLFHDLPSSQVYENHRWAITKLSQEVEGLASSETGYEVIRHRNKPQYGVQFHPEVACDDPSGERIFIALLEMLSQKGSILDQ